MVKQTKWITVLVIILVSFWGCIRDVDLNIKNKNREYVLNCILNTSQDTITARLTQTRNINSEEPFDAVKGAEITLLENDKNVGQFTSSGSSAYFLVYKPKPGTKYRMEAKIGNDDIWGETTVPKSVGASIEKAQPTNYLDPFVIRFYDSEGENYYWVSATGFEGALETRSRNIACSLYSNYAYTDDFNQRIASNGVYRFEYDYYIRFNDKEIPDSRVEIEFSPQCINYPKQVYLLSVDYHLDKYMKSSLLLERMDLYAEDMPVIYSPQPIYSNIHGGTGIFGSYVSVSKEF